MTHQCDRLGTRLRFRDAAHPDPPLRHRTRPRLIRMFWIGELLSRRRETTRTGDSESQGQASAQAEIDTLAQHTRDGAASAVQLRARGDLARCLVGRVGAAAHEHRERARLDHALEVFVEQREVIRSSVNCTFAAVPGCSVTR